MGGGGGEKTEQATPKRRQDERKKGNVFQSQEIGLLVSLLAVVYIIQFMGPYILGAITNSFDYFWAEAGRRTSLPASDLSTLFIQFAINFLISAGVPLVAAILVAVIVTMAQTRGLVSAESLKPKFSKLNPISGIKKMFSLRGIIELLKSIVKIIILAYVIYNQFSSRFDDLPRLMEMDFVQVLGYAGDFIMDIITSVAVIFAFLAGADYMYQRWQYEKDLRMTKQEIKEEYKQTEGDPQIKGKIREKQRAMSQSRMMANVPEADVIIRNPTHYAVAVRYEPEKDNAPVVLAKGADLLALRIIKAGEEHDVTVMENRALARGLYENVPLDREIPAQFFEPVAEVLAFVYNLKKKHKLPKTPRPN